jgi:NADH-quinone oxidoreductase subunit N
MRAEYPTLILFSALGMGIMASSRDLMTLYVGLELQSLAAYVLASFMRTDERSSEAGLKYFVLGALASGMLLYGISLLYGFTGTTDFAGIAKVMGGELNIGLIFGIVFVLAGLGFKISAVPFHMWTPDVYEGAPTPVTTFFASAPKVAAMALMTRVAIDAMGPAIGAWQQIMIFLALASIILGAVGAIGQKNIKRLLAYSSINNVGYILIGLAAGTQQGVEAVLTYLLVYVVTTIGSFLVVMQLRDDKGNQIESIPALAGYSQRRPGLAAAMAVFLFSLAGIPPLFGFWPKYLVFEAAVNANLVPLAVAGIVASVIGAFYYIAIIKTMYFDDKSDTEFPKGGGAIAEDAVITASALWLSVIGYLFIPALAVLSAGAAAVLF